jgi:hypothetical protein
VFLTPPGMVPGPSVVRDQLARASQAGVPNAPCLRAWPVRNLEGPPASLAGLLLACGVTGLHPAIGPR